MAAVSLENESAYSYAVNHLGSDEIYKVLKSGLNQLCGDKLLSWLLSFGLSDREPSKLFRYPKYLQLFKTQYAKLGNANNYLELIINSDKNFALLLAFNFGLMNIDKELSFLLSNLGIYDDGALKFNLEEHPLFVENYEKIHEKLSWREKRNNHLVINIIFTKSSKSILLERLYCAKYMSIPGLRQEISDLVCRNYKRKNIEWWDAVLTKAVLVDKKYMQRYIKYNFITKSIGALKETLMLRYTSLLGADKTLNNIFLLLCLKQKLFLPEDFFNWYQQLKLPLFIFNRTLILKLFKGFNTNTHNAQHYIAKYDKLNPDFIHSYLADGLDSAVCYHLYLEQRQLMNALTVIFDILPEQRVVDYLKNNNVLQVITKGNDIGFKILYDELKSRFTNKQYFYQLMLDTQDRLTLLHNFLNSRLQPETIRAVIDDIENNIDDDKILKVWFEQKPGFFSTVTHRDDLEFLFKQYLNNHTHLIKEAEFAMEELPSTGNSVGYLRI